MAFKVACHDLATSTDYFEKYKSKEIEFIDENEFRKKFQEITNQISNDMYGSGSSKSADSDTNLP